MGVVVVLSTRLWRLPDRGVMEFARKGGVAVSSLFTTEAIEFPVVLRTRGATICPGFEAILGVRGVRPTVLAAAALS